MKKLTVKQQEQRDALIFTEKTMMRSSFVYQDRYIGGTRHFEHLKPVVMRELLRLGFADPNEKQNDAPSLREFGDFIASIPENVDVELSGYAVSREREDHRVSINGILIRGEIDSSVRRLWWDMLQKHKPDSNEEDKNMLFAWWN